MTEIHSFQPLLDNTTELTRFRGTYFLTEFESRIGDEQHYWKLALADSSGELTVYCYDPEFIQSFEFGLKQKTNTNKTNFTFFFSKSVLICDRLYFFKR